MANEINAIPAIMCTLFLIFGFCKFVSSFNPEEYFIIFSILILI